MEKHPPKSDEPTHMSEEKVKWWAAAWSGSEVKQPRLAVLHHILNTTPRPTAPDETLAYGYMRLCKFHDCEPAAIADAIRRLDSDFFATYPRKRGTRCDDRFVHKVIGEAARNFYRRGMAAFGIPGLRKGGEDSHSSAAQLLGAMVDGDDGPAE